MKKMIILTALVAGSVFAKGKYDWNQTEYLAEQKTKAAKNGWKYNEKKCKEMFVKMDTDQNGIVTGQERQNYWKKPQLKKGKYDWDKAEFLADAQKKAKKNGWKYNEKKSKELFAKMDTNNDSIVTPQEREAYWKAWETKNKK